MATNISESQFSHVESTILSTALQASGLPYNFHRDIVTGASSHIGLNNSKLYVTQEHKNICNLVDFWKSDNIAGKHIRDAIEAHKLEAVCGGTLFKNNLITPS